MLSMTEGMIHCMQELHPERNAVGVETDGAGCYSGKFTRLALPELGRITGTRILWHSTGEAQMNKSSLDGHFGVAGPAVKASVAANKMSATTAAGVVQAHLRSGAIAHTIVREVELSLVHEGSMRSNAMKGTQLVHTCAAAGPCHRACM